MFVSRPFRAIWLAGLILGLPFVSSATTIPEEETISRPDSSRIIRAMEARAEVGREQVLERSIEPEKYMVGPGDELILTLWGEISESYPLKITPEGKVLVPYIGEISLAQLTLAQAQDKIVQVVGKQYRDVDISVSLSTVRKFRVFVVGAVNVPGTYTATAVDRVSMLIDQAGGFKPGASERNVEVKRRDSPPVSADLLRFVIVGDLKDNPYVQDGDVVTVPVRLDSVGVFGAVSVEGYYELKEGDRISDMVELAGGLVRDADREKAELIRFQEDEKTTEGVLVDLTKALVEGNSEHNLTLRSDDVLLVRRIPEWHPEHLVEVRGEVYYSGHYSIEKDKTYLSEVIERAGGFKPDASLTEARVIRTMYEETLDPEYERLSLMQVSNMSEEEYGYFKAKSRQLQGAVLVDFEKLFLSTDKSQDLLMRRGDIIDVPSVRKTVDVSGQVVNPGAVQHKPGKKLDYYIAQAGGYNWDARKSRVRVIKGSTGQWLKPRKVRRIDPGDTIWVPEKPERDYWTLFKDFVTVSASVATVVLVIQRVRE